VLYSQSYEVLYGSASLALTTATSGVITMPFTPVCEVNEACIRINPPEIELLQSTPHVAADHSHDMTDELVSGLNTPGVEMNHPDGSDVLTAPMSRKSTTRKRRCTPDHWQAKSAKKARAAGLAYVSRKGKKVEAKAPVLTDVLCREKCRMKCNERLKSENRLEIFQRFHAVDVNSKNNYLCQSITARDPKTLCVAAKGHRKKSFWYSVVIQGERQRVCKKAFTQLHQITNSKVDWLLRQIVAGKNAPSPDRRGKHDNRPRRTEPQKVAEVKEHISQFPAETSHYSRHENPSRLYLAPTLNISLMYRLYKEWCAETKKKPTSERMYRYIFNNFFNLGFGSPKSDTCAVCDLGADEAHKRQADKAFEIQRQDKKIAETTSDTFFITFDLQKTLPLPKLTTSVAFYLRQIWLYNLGIHLTCQQRSQPFFQIWSEADGSRGCGEVASSILAFLDASGISSIASGCGHLIAWSDS
jgi:hypothetical protein